MNPQRERASKDRLDLAAVLRSEKIRSALRNEPLCVAPGSPIQEALEGMRTRRSSCVLVCDRDELRGVFTERDHLDKIAGRGIELSRPIDDVMSAEPKSLAPEASLAEALSLIVDGGCRHIPVVDGARVVGLLTALDLVKYIAELFPTFVFNLPPDLDQVASQVEGG